jgi:hypothetical protein
VPTSRSTDRGSQARRSRRLSLCAAALITGPLLAGGGSGVAAAEDPSAAAVTARPPTGSITTIVSDPDDTGGPLDVRAVRTAVDAATGHADRVRYTVRTQDAFRTTDLHPRWRRFVLELDTDGQPGSERNVAVFARDGRLVAELESNATREVLAELDVRRTGPRSLQVSGAPEQVGARKVFWSVEWHRRGDDECGSISGWPVSCQDSVPDDGWSRLDRPAWP